VASNSVGSPAIGFKMCQEGFTRIVTSLTVLVTPLFSKFGHVNLIAFFLTVNKLLIGHQVSFDLFIYDPLTNTNQNSSLFTMKFYTVAD